MYSFLKADYRSGECSLLSIIYFIYEKILSTKPFNLISEKHFGNILKMLIFILINLFNIFGGRFRVF